MPEPLPSDTLNTNHADSMPATVPPFVAPLAPAPDAATELDPRGYQLMEALGKGGMGEVYRCSDPALGRDLAIKVIKDKYRGHPEVERRFLREAHITGSLQHPGIVAIHNLGRLADGRLHYTMRLIRGRTFADILKDEAGKPERGPELLTVFVKICQAVAYAHSKRVIHRDLKPSNVMVGKFGEVQVMDWGLAKVLPPAERGSISTPSADDEGTRIHTEAADASSELTRMGSGIGTPAYMPPEQALGEWDRVDERSDVFALGAILCEILTGAPPYAGGDGEEVYRRAKRGEVADALERLRQCGADAALGTLCRECVSPEREARPRDAGAVAQRVADYQAEVQARLQRAEVERARALVKAHEGRIRRWLISSSILLLSAVALLAVWQAVRATDARNTAERSADAERQAREAESEQRQRADEQKGRAEAAAREAQTAKQKAEQSKADTEAVMGFFKDKVLSAGRPQGLAGGQGIDVKMSEAVDKAEPEIAKAFADRPLVEASIRDTLGLTYMHLGKPFAAIPQLERVVQVRQTALGADHADTLTSMNHLALAYHDAGQMDKALPLMQQTLEKWKAKPGTDHAEMLQTMNDLAVLYWSAGQLDKALPLMRQTLEKMKAVFGPDHRETLVTASNLAMTYYSTGQVDKGLRLMRQTLDKMKATLPADHSDTLHLMNSLAMMYRNIRQWDKAIPLLEEAVKASEATLGPNNLNTLVRMHNLAAAYWSARKLDRSVPLLQETLKRITTHLSADHPETLSTLLDLAVNYRDAGRCKDAIALLENEIQRRRQQAGELPSSLLRELAQACEQDGQLAKAAIAYRDLLEQAQKQFGGDDPRTAGIMAQLGVNLLKQKKFADAETVLRQCLKIRDKKQADAWTTSNTRSTLGEALAGQKKFADAEPLLLRGYQELQQHPDKIPPPYRQRRLAEARQRLVQLYDAWGKPNEADKWRKPSAD